MKIIGAGLAGLIAGHYFRRFEPTIYEKQSSLPNNHHALLRFRTDAVSRITQIPFKKVLVRKEICFEGFFVDRPNVYLANTYSEKVTGKVMSRSVWDISPSERYIAPLNFVEQLSKGLKIKYEASNWTSGEPIISTIPMPALMDLLDWKHKPKFDYKHIWSINVDIQAPVTDVYQTIYFPSYEDDFYRASLCRNHLIIECIKEPKEPWSIVTSVIDTFGITLNKISDIDCKKQVYGKIVPIDDDLRKEFIYTATRDHGIYSVGRFATWKQILLDDVVNDLKVVDSLISVEGRRLQYNQSLAETGH